MDRTQYSTNIRKNIESYGRGVVGVYNNEYDDEVYTHFYSVGNPRFEYICFHPTDISGELIHKVAKTVARHPRNYNLNSQPFVELPGLLCDYHVDDYHLPYEQLVGLRRLRGAQEQMVRDRYLKAYQWEELQDYTSGVPIVQILLSDGNNLFPGMDGCNELFEEWTPEWLWV